MRNIDWILIRKFLGEQIYTNKDFDIDKFIVENEGFLL